MGTREFLPYPIFFIQASILDGLCDMGGFDGLCPLQVRNGTGDLEDAVVGTGGEAQLIKGAM